MGEDTAPDGQKRLFVVCLDCGQKFVRTQSIAQTFGRDLLCGQDLPWERELPGEAGK